jgi:hypothetical protein
VQKMPPVIKPKIKAFFPPTAALVSSRLRLVCALGILTSLVGMPEEVLATQVHKGLEGLVGHQIGHIFFIFSMGILIYWLRERKLIRETGWRFVQYAALFFILWNLDALVVHYLDGRHDLFQTIDEGTWDARIHLLEGPKGLAVLYYLVKMDHLLCLPAIVFLYLGLRQLLKQDQASRSQGGTS